MLFIRIAVLPPQAGLLSLVVKLQETLCRFDAPPVHSCE